MARQAHFETLARVVVVLRTDCRMLHGRCSASWQSVHLPFAVAMTEVNGRPRPKKKEPLASRAHCRKPNL